MRMRKLRTLPSDLTRWAPSLDGVYVVSDYYTLGWWRIMGFFFLYLLEGVEVAELLSNAEEDFALVNVATVPLDQLASRRDVFGDRLLG